MGLQNQYKLNEMSLGSNGGPASGSPTSNANSVMPDIAKELKNSLKGTLDFVGMSQVEVPVTVEVEGVRHRISAKGEAFVNLIQEEAKGIHMSRLYLALEEVLHKEKLTPQAIKNILEQFLMSHGPLSDTAFLSLNFELGLERTALISGRLGYRTYPVMVRGHLHDGKIELEMGVDVTYSSTCPCSAALARRLIQDQFAKDFSSTENFKNELNFDEISKWLGSTQGIVATPHSQRSTAKVLVKLKQDAVEFPLVEMINLAEKALKTPVQAAVKREDEQEFARLNGQNLMFCEDAARQLKQALSGRNDIYDFWLKCIHMESLHAHDAVSTTTKGVAGGYSAHLNLF